VVAGHRGGQTQIFGGKASEPETSRPVEKRNFYLPRLHLASSLGVIPSEFCRDLLHHKTRMRGALFAFSRFGTTPTCDRRTELTDGHVMTANTALSSVARVKTIESDLL